MAAGPQDPVRTTKEELVATLARSREALATDLPAFGRALNPVTTLKRSLLLHPTRWIAGSAIVGLVGTKILFTSRPGGDSHPEKKEAKTMLYKILGFALKTALATARPAAEKYVRKRLARIEE